MHRCTLLYQDYSIELNASFSTEDILIAHIMSNRESRPRDFLHGAFIISLRIAIDTNEGIGSFVFLSGSWLKSKKSLILSQASCPYLFVYFVQDIPSRMIKSVPSIYYI